MESGTKHDGEDEADLSIELATSKDSSYKTRIQRALQSLKEQSAKYLSLDGESKYL